MSYAEEPRWFYCCVCHSTQEVRLGILADANFYLGDHYYKFVCNDCFTALCSIVPMSEMGNFVSRTFLEGHIVNGEFLSQQHYDILRNHPKYSSIVETRMIHDVANRLAGYRK